MRLPNLIMQGLIAGAILFIPAEVFAEKENAEKRNPDAEQNKQSVLKQENATNEIPVQAGRKESESKPDVSEAKPKENVGNRPISKSSDKSAEVRKTDPAAEKANSSQKARNSIGVKKSVSQGQFKKNVPINQPKTRSAETSKLIHTETPLNNPKLLKKREVNENKKKLLVPKEKSKEQQEKAVPMLPLDLPSKEIPEHPASKAIPITAGQSSSHSSSTKDGANGTASLANFKASLVLPLIFAESEKVFVYFSRMDLLRSQWVNAPPSRPPETAL